MRGFALVVQLLVGFALFGVGLYCGSVAYHAPKGDAIDPSLGCFFLCATGLAVAGGALEEMKKAS